MAEEIRSRILEHVKSEDYRPVKPRGLAREMDVTEDQYPAFRHALRELMNEGRVTLGMGSAVILPAQQSKTDGFVGTYRHNRRGFGFVIPTELGDHEDLFIPEGQNGGAITGDIVKATITSRGQRDGKALYTGRIIEIIQRTNKRFAGSLVRLHGEWVVLPDGNTFTDPILTPDAAARSIKPGTKVVVELTAYPEGADRAQGVITEVLGDAGEKDVDLRSVIVQHSLPEEFPDEVREQASTAVSSFNEALARGEFGRRIDLGDQIICTIDPPDAKDYDDAISLARDGEGNWELGVHIADVSAFVPAGSPLDVEARKRGNSIYFPGHVIPMLPEILSNGVCSLQEGVPRLCKSAMITLDGDSRPIRTRFANTIIRSRHRLRYTEAQAIIDGADTVPHPDGPRPISSYDSQVVKLLADMNGLAKNMQKRRRAAGQIVLDLPEVRLLLDDGGKVIGAEQEDQSFTHTIIEMFMVEANEAVARLLDTIQLPFLRRVHPEPETDSAERLRHFVQVAGHKLPKIPDRKALQTLLGHLRGRPEAFAVNLAVLKSLSRAEYSPEVVGHYALASEHYCHFTSPIRRYADLTIHRLLDAHFAAAGPQEVGGRRHKVNPNDVPSYADLVELGKQISFTERRAADAERELRQVKILELLVDQVGEVFPGVVTGITNFGIFVQLQNYLIDGLIRYEHLMDDWWDVDERSGTVRGQRSGKRIGIGDLMKIIIVNVDVARRELNLAVAEHLGRQMPPPAGAKVEKGARKAPPRGGKKVILKKAPPPRGKPARKADGTRKRRRR